MKKRWMIVLMLACAAVLMTACESKITATGTKTDTASQVNIANELSSNQPTPTDISYSLERYNLIRRAYWVNGQREKANTLVCEIDKLEFLGDAKPPTAYLIIEVSVVLLKATHQLAHELLFPFIAFQYLAYLRIGKR